jgi:hypothetical protein
VEQPIDPIFKDKAVEEGVFLGFFFFFFFFSFFLQCLTLEDGTDRVSENISN